MFTLRTSNKMWVHVICFYQNGLGRLGPGTDASPTETRRKPHFASRLNGAQWSWATNCSLKTTLNRDGVEIDQLSQHRQTTFRCGVFLTCVCTRVFLNASRKPGYGSDFLRKWSANHLQSTLWHLHCAPSLASHSGFTRRKRETD